MYLAIADAAALLGVTPKTLRVWEKAGFLVPERTPGQHRRYDAEALLGFYREGLYSPSDHPKTGCAAIYARVSSPKQKEDLVRQKDFFIAKATADGFTPLVYSDIGSGLNDSRPNLLRLLKDGLDRKFDKLYLTYYDRLARFGTRPLLEVLDAFAIGVEAVQIPDAQPYEPILDPVIIANF
jgi:predicted site-specific integrase-resolvase